MQRCSCICRNCTLINNCIFFYSPTTFDTSIHRIIKVIKDKEEISEVFNLRKQERIDEVKQNKIYDVEVKPRIISSQMENGKIIYQGEISLTFIYGQEGTTRINIKSLVEPFEFTVTSNSIAKKMRTDTSIEIAKKDFVVMADSTIDIKVDLNFRLNIVKESSINLIESVTESEKKDRESFSIIVYYARVGDTLWKIAKKFGSHIVWIVGRRISEYYKIKESTKRYLKLEFKREGDDSNGEYQSNDFRGRCKQTNRGDGSADQ